MKTNMLLALFCSLAAAVPFLEHSERQTARDIPNCSGIQFSSDGKLSISVFSDLHFGERESLEP